MGLWLAGWLCARVNANEPRVLGTPAGGFGGGVGSQASGVGGGAPGDPGGSLSGMGGVISVLAYGA